MKQLLLILFTVSLALSISCDTSSESGSGGLDNTFNFGFREYYEAENSLPVFGISIATNEQFGCINYRLVTSHKLRKNVLSISMDDVNIGDICLTAIGPATTFIPLDLDNGDYGLELINGETTEYFLLDVSQEKVQVIRQDRNEFKLPSYTFETPFVKWYRYPKNSFALVGGTNTTNTHLYENFLAELKNNFSVSEFSFPQDAYIPYPREGSGHWVDFPASFFTYPTEEEFNRIGEFLIEYSSNNIKSGTGVGFSLTNWKNVRYLSWLHDRD